MKMWVLISLVLGAGCAHHTPTERAGFVALVGNTRGDSVARVDLATGALLEPLVPAATAGLSAPDDIVLVGNELWVSSGCPTGFGRRCDPTIPAGVLRFDARSGAFRGAIVDTVSTPDLWRPYGIAVAADGAFYVASFANERLLAFDPSGKLTRTLASAGPLPRGSGGLNGPNDVAIGPDGAVYVTTEGATNIDGVLDFPGLPSEILRFDPVSGAATLWGVASTPPGGAAPSLVGIAFGPDGTLYSTDYMNAEILAFSSKGEVVRRAPLYTGARPEKAYAGDLVFVPGLGLVVAWGTDADVQQGAISIVDPESFTVNVVRPLGPGLQRPLGVAVLPAAGAR